MMFSQRYKKMGPREEYQQQEGQRINDSITLSEKFRDLSSLTADLVFYDAESLSKKSELKCTFNLDHAKSVFYFKCPNDECIRGNFDLSEDLALAVAEHRAKVTGKRTCQGWLSKTTIDKIHCHNVLEYTLGLGYRPA